MQRTLAALIFCFAAAAVALPLPEDRPADDTKTTTAPVAVAKDKAEVPLAERLPPGFKVKKRGKHTLYCKTDTPLGTRFKSETCYDEPNMRAYMLALQENKSDVDRIRSTCSSLCACGMPEAC